MRWRRCPKPLKKILLCEQGSTGTLQLLMVDQNSIGTPQQLRRLHKHHVLDHVVTALHWFCRHHVLDHMVMELHLLPCGGSVHMDQLFREVSLLPVPLDRTRVQKLEIGFLRNGTRDDVAAAIGRTPLETLCIGGGQNVEINMAEEQWDQPQSSNSADGN
ncbi:hypothetical protein COCON_G00051020 [Conger conger]|uniref:Uncharacterized protein n=1 Tax=Conger conger TaxID=82655 RepID=A0A9Q1I5M4_CONCO|nr:hypothetical protein COCON_G00051020 [Conger conger]